ncbi:MAG: BadF/BadG/BcrA/BcrD ATPase family protein [Acidobacteriaceae bacterium]|jgi:N-acetylglucosamine kinase-like BadF-type ATPase
MSLFLAIDAGGTKTQCLIADDERVLARATTGTVKLMRVSEQEATARLQAMLAEVAATAGVSLGQVERTCFGLAGASGPAVQAWAQRTVTAVVAGELILCGDEEIALDAAFAGGAGILVIAGTGSNAIGRSASGELFSAGGWGPVLGDEGSGYWIGLEAIRAALRAQDRMGVDGVASCLLGEIEEHWGLRSVAELVAMANQRTFAEGATPPDFAGLAPVVARCAEGGDVLAAGILERAGEELAELVSVVFQKMHAGLSIEAGEIGVAFTGSVLAQIATVRGTMVARLGVTVPSTRVRDAAVDPLDGALRRARQG